MFFNIHQKLPLNNRRPEIVSVAQFRPEKDHMLQLHAFARLLEISSSVSPEVKLVFIGGMRSRADELLVEELKREAQSLGIEVGRLCLLSRNYLFHFSMSEL
jgi:alpha-1,2-mannosyltransferase